MDEDDFELTLHRGMLEYCRYIHNSVEVGTARGSPRAFGELEEAHCAASEFGDSSRILAIRRIGRSDRIKGLL